MARPYVRMQNKFPSSLGKVSIDEESQHLDAALGDNSFDGIVNEKESMNSNVGKELVKEKSLEGSSMP
ncbi:hypothetical protein AALP_AA6G291100 [Arabis alpina]|uniref:Uncharacterized protein n=1 Tax=Arabis alpina TaxID=50452 RepID=A0A087GSG2_ARAAL|nr:hypothetical protein AALP_AA6G291100 [Arabis alpina]